MNLDLGDTRYIIEYAKSNGVFRNQLAYILATAYHETAHTVKPIKETVMAYHKDKNPSDATVVGRLNAAFKKGLLGSVKNKYWLDGWFGRGYVQLTHEPNYKKMNVTKSQALEKEHATRVIVDGMMDGSFTGKKLSDFVTLKKSDFFNARDIINPDKNYKPSGAKVNNGNLIAGYAKEYDSDLKAEGYGESTFVEEKKPASSHKMRIGTWSISGMLSAVLPFVHWSTQLFISAAIVALAVYAIITIPSVRNKIKAMFE